MGAPVHGFPPLTKMVKGAPVQQLRSFSSSSCPRVNNQKLFRDTIPDQTAETARSKAGNCIAFRTKGQSLAVEHLPEYATIQRLQAWNRQRGAAASIIWPEVGV
jgi:hypothetical protein